MKLTACLNSADIQTLRRIAKHYELSCSLFSKHALIQEILFTFKQPAFVMEQAKHWRTNWGTMYIRLCLALRTQFSVEEVEALFGAGQDAKRLQAVLDEGWLFPLLHIHGRPCYCIPEDLLPLLRDELLADWRQRLQLDTEGPLLYNEESLAMERDLDVFLEYIQHHDVPLTTDGCMYKRNFQQLCELLEITPAADTSGWRFGYGRRFHDYPDRFALIYDFAYHHKLIEESQQLLITEEGISWRTHDTHVKQQRLVLFYVSLYRRPIPRLPQLVRILAYLSSEWIEATSAFAVLEPLVNAYYYDTPQTVWRQRILQMLTHLGLLRLGTDEMAGEWFQITKLGQELLTQETLRQADEGGETQRVLIVQPNFDILVDSEDARLTAHLAQFATLKEAGALRLYRISEATVREGLQRGHDIQHWMDMLSKRAGAPIPGNVERTIADWADTIAAEQHLSS